MFVLNEAGRQTRRALINRDVVVQQVLCQLLLEGVNNDAENFHFKEIVLLVRPKFINIFSVN